MFSETRVSSSKPRSHDVCARRAKHGAFHKFEACALVNLKCMPESGQGRSIRGSSVVRY